MSRVTVYAIRNDGQVESFGDARCAPACAMHIWHELYKQWFNKPMPFGDSCESLWREFYNPQRPELERIAMGFTFDTVWVKRENIERLVDALKAFWRGHAFIDYRGCAHAVSDTIPKVVDLLERVAVEDVRGVCFQQTSVADTVWWMRDGEDDDGHMFVFGKDEETRYGTPFELFEALAPKPRAAFVVMCNDAAVGVAEDKAQADAMIVEAKEAATKLWPQTSAHVRAYEFEIGKVRV